MKGRTPIRSTEPVRQVPTNVVLPVVFREKLRLLALTTRVPQAEYIREAIRDLLTKYHEVLEAGSGGAPNPR